MESSRPWNEQPEYASDTISSDFLIVPEAGTDSALKSLDHSVNGTINSARDSVVRALDVEVDARTMERKPATDPHSLDNLSFYEERRVDVAEAERLQFMALIADAVSLQTIGANPYELGLTVLDIGAGDSTTLGGALSGLNETIQYTPVDMRTEAISKHREAGYDAQHGYATELPFPDASQDVLHARFTFGWLDKDGRERAFEEMLRVGKENAKIIIIDYDWTKAEGPPELEALIRKITGLMSTFGFDPNYGSKVANEINSFLNSHGLGGPQSTVEEDRFPIQETLNNALGAIDITLQPVTNLLVEMGRASEANELQALFADIQRLAKEQPEAIVRFPDIVATVISKINTTNHKEAVGKISDARVNGAEALQQETMQPVGPPELGVYRLTSDQMISRARRLHANSYTDHGYVTEEGVTDEGILIDEIDPLHIVQVSTYLGTVNQEGTVTGCIRLIEAQNGSIDTLPTIAKIRKTLHGDKILSDLPFLRESSRVFEGSAMGRSAQAKDRVITSKLLIAGMYEGMERGYEYSVMSIIENVSKLLLAVYGEQAFKRIGDESAVTVLKGKGLNPKGVRLIPFYVHIPTFLQDCEQHFANHPSQFLRMNLPLFEITSNFIQASK